MAKVTCAISGIRFSCDYLECLNITNEAGFMHPIFAADHRTLHLLYSRHSSGKLHTVDSYLLFLALLHSTGKVEWRQPASVDTSSLQCVQLVENNIAQLITALTKTDYIRHPSFSQPSFTVTENTSDLRQIPNYIKAWLENIEDFYSSKSSEEERNQLQVIENKLTKLILSGESPERFAATVATWASRAAAFPTEKSELWRKTIQSCFSINKMFNTPLALLKEIKEYCECNIEVGSIHFHTLFQVLQEGIKRHVDYLGGSSLALGYTLLDSCSTTTSLADKSRREQELKGDAEIKVIAANAPAKYPKQEDYPTSLAFLKAKLAYRVATVSVCTNVIVVPDKEESNDN